MQHQSKHVIGAVDEARMKIRYECIAPHESRGGRVDPALQVKISPSVVGVCRDKLRECGGP
jgi:hypothetical protein